MIRTSIFISFFTFLISFSGYSQTEKKETAEAAKEEVPGPEAIYKNGSPHSVAQFSTVDPGLDRPVKNIILMIGDGMGTSQVYAGITANKGQLNLEQCPITGFSKTSSSDSYITDSAAGATAIASGEKTYNGAIGVDVNGDSIPTILELAELHHLSTGLIATCDITHATPAAFIAHEKNRGMAEAIAADFLNTDIDLFIGGGLKRFNQRADSVSLTDVLREKGYEVVTEMTALNDANSSKKLAALVAEEHLPPEPEGRGDYLERSTDMAINRLKANEEGFFLMVESSQIDWGGHANHTTYIAAEMLDFDRAIGKALQFASENGETLVIITADHETGGFALTGGDLNTGEVKGGFTTGGHTAVMVPVFAFGPQAIRFSGVYENTAIFHKMKEAFGF